MLSRTSLFASIALTSVSLFGCDPGMPGAAGTIELGSGVDASQFANIELRAIPVEGAFDPENPAFPTQVSDNLYQTGEGPSAAWVGDLQSQEDGVIFLQKGQALSDITFPFEYQLGGDGIGYTELEHWRLFAWLSTNADSHLVAAPAAGEPYGVVDWDAKSCGMSGYCSLQTGVNVTIDKIAP